ncbi:carbohydrate ABC transporter permease [Microvirga guangxiensis]|uniref:Carbohydrate ABC transporter membrane protein 1, CUT1 family n=1 Tax=Microvirga guangxiensis TaxID=549386 RepID=A0A1G5KLB5_9HYPH|nr:sugar ABC transporter permease [Microvirga guangxiensis]SCZ01372.1 carbohydrate ABC transporter membrane protein 1, CUT1 family [Microvirga guangxiensis]
MTSRSTGLLYIVPAFSALALVLFSPVFYGFWFSLHRIRYGTASEFIGLGNYTQLLSDPGMAATFGRTAIHTAVSVALTVAISLAIALWVHRLPPNRGSIVQMIVIIPWITSTVVATLLFKWVFISDIGMAMSILRMFGLPDLQLLSDPNSAMGLLIAVSVWKRLGYALIILLAGLKSIPEDYEEAASLDGAGPWDIFRLIILPLLKTPLLLIVIVLTLSNINTVESPLVLTGGGPGSATRILAIDVFDRAFVNYDLGSATSLALIMFLGNVLLVLAYVRLSKWKV